MVVDIEEGEAVASVADGAEEGVGELEDLGEVEETGAEEEGASVGVGGSRKRDTGKEGRQRHRGSSWRQ